MAIYSDDIPYLVAQPKVVFLPFGDIHDNNRSGFGNLIFPLTENPTQTIHIINDKTNAHHNGKYYYYYYNLLYRGAIAGRSYNIKDAVKRKELYDKVEKSTVLHAHPPTLLNKAQNRNCYFEMSTYVQIFRDRTKSFTPQKKLNLFWTYFRSIWESEQTSTYGRKIVLIDANMYSKFTGTLKDNIDNPIFILYYTLYKYPELIKDLNIDFIIYAEKYILKVNPSLCDEKSYLVFKREMNKVFGKHTGFESLSEVELDKENQRDELKESLSKKYNFTGDEDNTKELTNLDKVEEEKVSTKKAEAKSKIDKKIDEKIETATKTISQFADEKDMTSDKMTEVIKSQAELEIDDDKEIIDDLYKMMQEEKVPSKPVSSARDEQLRKRQEEIKIGSMTMAELSKVKATKRTIQKKDISKSVKTINENMKEVKFVNINKDYIDNVLQADILSMVTCLNNKSSKFYVKKVEVEDSSNELNYKETYRITLEDEIKNQHVLTFDIPKFLDHKFMYLGGNKKVINKQNFLFPVVKTAPDTVQIVTNYNKMFIRRLGTKSISSVERIMKLIQGNDECYKYFTVGNNSSINKSYLTTIEYDEFSKVITKFQKDKTLIMFNQKDAIEYAEEREIEIPENHIFIGVKDNENIFLNADTQETSNGSNICDLIITELPESLRNEFNKTRSTKKLMYNTVTIMAQTIPFIVLLLYWEGITSVINKIGLKYRFESKYPSVLKSNESVFKFKDAYFVYEEDLATSLLMNGIRVLDTENYNMDEYNTVEPYLGYFKKVYGKVSIINALSNAYDFTIDPITLEILDDINLPTDLVELCIYASNLLADESYTIENSQVLSRVRSIEIIPAILYNEISSAFITYKNSGGKKKLSIPKDCVIKELLGLQTVEDYSTLNPVVELEKDRSITSKGFRGINVERAYTEEKRSYDDSMIGIIAMSTSPDGNCGINRFLTMEPNITSARGYVDIKSDKKEELKDVNLFSPTELLYPLGNTRDDSIRIAMAGKQSKHVIPVQNSIPALISNGADEAIRFNLSSDFIINAEQDGTVIDYDEKNKILMVEYKNGEHRAINLEPQIVKNGGGGFFLNNQLVTNYKVGDKFKKDETLAYHKDFFKEDKFNGVRMNVGVLEKVAIVSSYNSYNDSTVITHKLAEDAKAYMTFCKSVVLGKNSNVYNMRKVGDHVNIGDSLIDFDTSFDDSDLNKLLAHLSEENKQVFEENAMNSIKSKYAGKIIDIKIYSTVDLEELSESLQKIVKSYYSKVNSKKKFVSKYDPNNTSIVKCGLLLNETTGKVEPNIYGVIKGQKVQDSVLIEFYIEHADIMGVGDKLA